MKYLAVFVLSVVGLSSANLVPLGAQNCPPGTKLYSIPGCGYVTREATCREYRARPDKQQTCAYAACHCISPTVRNEATGQCVHLDKCPGARIIHTHGGHGVPKIQRRQVPHKPHIPLPLHPTPPVAVPNTGYNGYNAGYNNANTGYSNYNTGYNNARPVN